MYKPLLIVDTSIFLHKAIYVEEYGGDSVYTFWEYIKMLKRITKSKHVVFTLDETKRTFRHKLYLPYKAQRPEKTEEFQAFKKHIESKIKHEYLYEVSTEYESDDYVGSLAKQYPGKVYIASADLDLSQLVDDRVTMLKPTKNKYDPEKPVNPGFEVVTPSYVVNRLGVYPYQVPDWKALAGDTSDNIKLPIKGLGDVAASKMLILYDNIEGIYNNLEDEDFPCPKFKEDLIKNKPLVELFLKLTTIKCDLECSSLSKILDK
jgi:DNA polymerase-1